MSTHIDWGRLFEQGRCKNVGIPWSEAEAKARASGVPAEYVRRGCLTMEEYESALKADQEEAKVTGTIALGRLKKGQLLAIAEKVNKELEEDKKLVYDVSKVTIAVLVEELLKRGVPEKFPRADVPKDTEEDE